MGYSGWVEGSIVSQMNDPADKFIILARGMGVDHQPEITVRRLYEEDSRAVKVSMMAAIKAGYVRIK